MLTPVPPSGHPGVPAADLQSAAGGGAGGDGPSQLRPGGAMEGGLQGNAVNALLRRRISLGRIMFYPR